jgi:hypothetical protein
MRLNFYFEFPLVDNIDSDNIEYQGGSITHTIAPSKLYTLCKKLYPEIEFKAIDSRTVDFNGNPGTKPHAPVYPYSHFYTIIKNPDNNKYFVISYWDKLRGMSEYTFWDMKNCVEIFAAAGIQDNEIDYRPCPDINYTPISCMSLFKESEDRIQEVYKQPKIIPERLYFKGGEYDIRKYLYKDGRIEMDNVRVSPKDFIDIIAKYSINIDINGAAEISCRTLDVLGLQSALIRPRLSIQFHNPLIPNYHYADLNCDDLGNWKQVADAYIERFEDLKKDPELVHFLSVNGRKWYEENATIDAHVNILSKVINFNKLK